VGGDVDVVDVACWRFVGVVVEGMSEAEEMKRQEARQQGRRRVADVK